MLVTDFLSLFNYDNDKKSKDDKNTAQTWSSKHTDYTLCEYMKNEIKNLEEIHFIGEDYITDQGIIWMCNYLKEYKSIKKVILRSCNKLTEVSLFALLNVLKKNSTIDVRHTNIKFVPKEFLEDYEIIFDNCILGYTLYDKPLEFKTPYSIIIWSSKSVNINGFSLFSDSISQTFSGYYLEHLTNIKIGENIPLINAINFRLTEVPIHTIIPKFPGQILILLKDDKEEAFNHLIETIAYFLASEISTVPCPKVKPPIYKDSDMSVSDNRIEPKNNFQKQKFSKKSKESKSYNKPEVFTNENPFLEHSNFGYKNISVSNSIITNLRDVGSWVSKIGVDINHSILEIRSTEEGVKLTQLDVGFYRMKNDWINIKPTDDFIFNYSISQGIINYLNKSYLLKDVYSCKNLIVRCNLKQAKTVETDLETEEEPQEHLFFSLELDGIMTWSYVFELNDVSDIVPYIIINQNNCSVEIGGDWKLFSNRSLVEESKIIPTEAINTLRFIALCCGANCQPIYEDITNFDWPNRISGIIKKLEDLISDIMKKDDQITFMDSKLLSDAHRQLEQLNSFILNRKERLFIFKLETMEKSIIENILCCIGDNIKKDIEYYPYKFAPTILEATCQMIIKMGNNYVTLDFLLHLKVIQNRFYANQVFQKMSSEGRGIFIKKFNIFILNIGWFDKLLHETINMMPFESDYRVLGCHGSTKVRTMESVVELLNNYKVELNDHSLWLEFFMDLGLLIQLPCIRHLISDEPYLFINPMLEGSAKKSHLEIIRKYAETIPQKVEAKVIYKKICQDLYSIYPQLLSKTVSIGQLQLISPMATVIHINGGVEILIECGEDLVTITAYMPLPLLENNSAKLKLNLIHYLWSILHLFLDAFEALLTQENILYSKVLNMVEMPTNYSVCYNHKWFVETDHNNICSMCGNCSSIEGINCPYNRINSQKRGFCLCLKPSRTCADCGICISCAYKHWTNHCESDPCRSIVFENETFISQNMSINAAFSTSFFVDNYHDKSNTFIGIKRDDDKSIIDMFGVSDTIDRHRAMVTTGSNHTISPLNRSTLSFSISDLSYNNLNLYQFSKCSGVNIVQELGIITYEEEYDIGIIIGQFPISKTRNQFSIEILNPGEYGRITIGLVPLDYRDGQPGWYKNSIAYHGDDGGIFSGGTTAKFNKEPFSVTGTCVELNIAYKISSNTTNRFISWKKNGKLIHEMEIETDEVLYPAVGFHSKFEQVKLLDSLAWRNDEIMSDINTDETLNNEVTVSPKRFIYFQVKNTVYGIFHIIPRKTKLKTVLLNVFNKSKNQKPIHCGLQSYNKLLNTKNEPGCWSFENISYQTLLSFQLIILSDFSNLRENSLHMTVSNDSGGQYVFEWDFIDIDKDKINNDYVIEVPNQYIEPTAPSMLLTTNISSITMDPRETKDSINKINEITKYYHIPRGNYKLVFSVHKSDAWIRSPNFIKSKLTPSYQIGNIIEYNSKPAVVINVNKETKTIKVTGHTEPIEFKSNKIKPLSRLGKSLLSLNFHKDNKSKFFNISNKSLLMAPPPSRPSLELMYLEEEDQNYLSEIYFGNECCHYHGINICLINAISTSQGESVNSDKSYNMISLPLNNIDQDLSYFIWEHSLMHLISWKNILFYPLCAGKSTQYDSKPHLLDVKGVQGYPDGTTPTEAFKLIYFNKHLLHVHRQLLNNKFLLPRFEQILPKVSYKFSKIQIEFLLLSMLEKVTTYMLLTNLFCDTNNLFDGNQPSLTLDTSGVSCKLHSSDNQEEISVDELVDSLSSKDEKSITDNAIFNYAQCSQSVVITGKTIKKLPDDFFDKFSNLKSLEMRKMFQLESLPLSIYNLKGLQKLNINQLKLTNLPEIWQFPNLKNLEISQCPIINQHDGQECKRLEMIKLSALPLYQLPSFLCNLNELVYLEIQLHGLQTLPKEFKNLINLQELKIIGSPLFYELTKPDSNIRLHDHLEFLYPEINIYPITDKTKPTTTFLSAADVFTITPRIGSGYSISMDTGGFPTTLLNLPMLKSLSIHYQSIRYVPAEIENLKNLESLDLSFNPLLERISGELSLIKPINKLTLFHCPSLTVPPLEVITRGSSASISYLKYLLAKSVNSNRTKLMFVGLGEAGKTSLLYALRSTSNSAQEFMQSTEAGVTDGIDITNWVVSNNDGEIQFSTWDFAGQDVYYNTHQFFLSSKAIYIVVWSVRQGIEHGDLDFWLSSISCHAKDAPIFVVGTRCDQVKADTSCFTTLKKRYPQIEDFSLVDSFSGTGIKDLKERLLSVTLNLPYMNKAIPSTILELESKIIAKRLEKNYMTFQEFEDLSLFEGIFKKDVKNVMKILHDFGSIQYFDTEMLKSYVVINPQWIVDIMANVVSIVNKTIVNGIFYHHDMVNVWKTYDSNLYTWMLNLTEEFDLTYPHPTKEPKANIVPCLLSEEEPEIKWPSIKEQSKWKYFQINYRFEFLPAGLFNRIQVRLFDFTETKIIWKFGSYFEKNGHFVLLKRESKNNLTIRSIGVRPINVMAMIDDIIRNLIKTSFYGVNFNMEISCPDCVEEGNNKTNDATDYWSHISMISSATVKKAVMKKVEYLQCSELHLNSLKSIKENTPEVASAEEFLEDLMSKVQTVKSLYASTEKSVVLLHSEKDFTDSSLLPMTKFDEILDDLNLISIKINETNMIKWKMSISNCHLCLIGLSEHFLKADEIMNDILEYIKLMNKKFILLILNTNINFKENWSYYPYFMAIYIKMDEKNKLEKHEELRRSIQQSTEDQSVLTTKKETYDCFISYCWSNSQDAVDKGRKYIPGAIVCREADPRYLYSYLTKNGISCWIDESNLIKTSGLNTQLSKNLINSKMMISFVSEEYNKSDNCRMELNFMVEELKRQVIYVLCGTVSKWRFNSEVGLIMHKTEKSKILDFTNKSLISEEMLLQNVKETLKECKDIVVRRDTKKEIYNPFNAFSEQVELIYRQFLNQLIVYTQEHCPRLVVLDVGLNKVKEKSILLSNEANNEADSIDDALYMKVICECEGGWHIVDDVYQVTSRDMETIIESCSVYLFMIYQILEYKNPGLECLLPSKVHKIDIINKITKIASLSKISLRESYNNMIKFYMKYDSDLSKCSLKRYHMPSGRELWMCDKDAKNHPRSKLIERDASTKDSIIVPLEEYDKLLLLDIKTKAGEEMLKFSDSFRNIITLNKTDETDSTGLLQPLLLPSHKYLRSDTILNIERDIVTNYSKTYTRPIRLNHSINSDNNPNTTVTNPTNRKLSLIKRETIMGSRICLIQ